MHWKAPGFKAFVVITPMEHVKVGIPEGTKPGRHVMLHDWPLGSTPLHVPLAYGGAMGGTVQLPARPKGLGRLSLHVVISKPYSFCGMFHSCKWKGILGELSSLRSFPKHLMFPTPGLLNGARDVPAQSFGLKLADLKPISLYANVHFVYGSVGRNKFHRPVHLVYKGMKKNIGSANFNSSECMREV
jgi:hypothetical protein